MQSADIRQPIGERLKSLARRWFPERQIVIREGVSVRALTLSTRMQTYTAAGVLVFGVWALVGSIGYGYQSYKVDKKNAEIERTRIAYHELIEEVSSQHGKFLSITKDLNYYRSYLLTLIEQNEGLRNDLASIHNRLEDSETEKERYASAEDALRKQLHNLESELTNLSERNDLLQTDVSVMRTRIVSTEDERRRAAAARAAIDRNIARLEGELLMAQNRTVELEKILVQKQQVVDQAQAGRRQAVAERDAAVEKANQIETHMASLTQQQQQALSKLQERTQGALQKVEAVFAAAGVDPKRLAPIFNGRDGRGARGGPFVPWSEQVKGLAPEVQGKSTELGTALEKLEVLRPVLTSLPMAVPVKADYAVMSGFGYRRDPFNGRAALHEGLDLQAALRTPIRPGAPGKVVFAGWHPQYGRLVEVDHGYSIRTRYAHMDELSVTDGQEVDRNTVLGLMGRSGRASGIHLHYEVVVNGRPLDPANFMKAASNVLKIK